MGHFVRICVFVLAFAGPAWAQDTYIQLEAYSKPETAQARIPQLVTRLPDIVAHEIPAGWVAISMGPYSPDNARALLRQFRLAGQVNQDAYLTEGKDYRARIYPPIADATATQAPSDGPEAETQTQATQIQIQAPTTPQSSAAAAQPLEAPTQPDPEPQAIAPDETRAQALQSERGLTRQDKRDLQTAMAWAGAYQGAIDGLYGPGTRRAMQAWQEQNEFDPTGVLTTLQRAKLLQDYNAVLDGLDLALVRDEETGVEVKMPRAVLPNRTVGYPFVSYTGSDNIEVHVISRPGDKVSFEALYSVLQTLEMLPPEGERRLQRSRFVISGQDSRKTSFAQAQLKDGMIRGFVLVWPNDDEARRTRVLAEMQSSFGTFGRTVLSEDNLRDTGAPLSTVALRTPRHVQSGFFVSTDGAILTALDDLDQCGRISQMTEDQSVGLVAQDKARNIALLRPMNATAPMAMARLADKVPAVQSEIAIAGFSYEGVLGAPTLTFGTIAQSVGLNGETTRYRLAAMANPSDAGGAVLDAAGAVIGMLLPNDVAGKRLPLDVAFSVPVTELRAALHDWGVTAQSVDAGAPHLTAHDTSLLARNIVTLIQCWD